MATSCVTIPNRAAIHIGGDDRFTFLQGLITQDIEKLKTEQFIYSCLLTSNGKFLFDFFAFEQDDIIIIDCENGERAERLLKSLKKFKLRSKVTLDLHDHLDVWQIFGDDMIDAPSSYKDPRHDNAGYRVYTNPQHDITDFSVWDKHRITLEIPDGSRDMIPEKSFLHESDIIATTAVSYTKGCYMGQELVSRMHHRGLAKKKLQCVNLNTLSDDADIRSTCGDIGLALVRL